jgi:electron transfer flavoprotein alpha subunit
MLCYKEIVRIVVLVKQVPEFEAMRLRPDGRLEREGLELEMNPYCRRAVSKGVEFARATGGTCTVVTLGPPSAADVLREAIAWGADDGVLITDPAFAGSDTLATAHALNDAIGDADLILCGRNSVDADTGQVPPELAELRGVPFLGGVRRLEIDGGVLHARCELDDGWAEVVTTLPAVVSCAERLCEPAKVDPGGRAAVDPSVIMVTGGAAIASPTQVGEVRRLQVDRERRILSGTIAEQVRDAVAFLKDRGALQDNGPEPATVPEPQDKYRVTAVILEDDRAGRELLGGAARLGGRVVALCCGAAPREAASWGADEVVELHGSVLADDVTPVVNAWCESNQPWAVLAAGTMWGREVMARVAARQHAGLTGDAVDLSVRDHRLVAWKPAFGGSLVAAITATSTIQMVTVRAGVLPLMTPRQARAIGTTTKTVPTKNRVRLIEQQRDDEVVLSRADVVVGVGAGVAPEDYPKIEELCLPLDAVIAATRKVTDKGWMPRSRQVGLTGRSIGPRLYIALGLSGKFNHTIGIRGAGAVLAVNPDPAAPIWEHADVGIQAMWQDVVPLLTRALYAETGPDRLTAASSVPK